MIGLLFQFQRNIKFQSLCILSLQYQRKLPSSGLRSNSNCRNANQCHHLSLAYKNLSVGLKRDIGDLKGLPLLTKVKGSPPLEEYVKISPVFKL